MTRRRGSAAGRARCAGRAIATGLALLALAACSQESGGAGQPSSRAAGSAPSFVLPDLAGRPFDLAEHRGKTVVIDFWATWCPPCVFQVPELNAFWRQHRDGGAVMVVGVAVDAEGAAVVGPWVEEQGVEYPIVIGDEGLARTFGALGFPTLVILAPDGSIESSHVGLIEARELEGLVARASSS
jgi:thiol-disulfide isomerase/thioredoxin